MFRFTTGRRFVWKVHRLTRPPQNGYELTEFENEALLRQFIRFHSKRVCVVMVHAQPEKPPDSAGQPGAPTSSSSVPGRGAKVIEINPKSASITGIPEVEEEPFFVDPKAEEAAKAAAGKSTTISAGGQKKTLKISQGDLADRLADIQRAQKGGGITPGERGFLVNQKAPNARYDEIARKLIVGFNYHNLGDPKEVRIATISAPKAQKLIEENDVMALPTCLIFYQGKVMSKVIGGRPNEVAVKTKFLLRNEGMNIFAV